jgi:Planctomycete cytochrome C
MLPALRPVLPASVFLVCTFAAPAQSAEAILEAKCLNCHESARLSDLDLRRSDTILKGGKRGPAVVPGKAEQSLLYKAVKREGDLQMPPGKVGLSPAEVAVMREWINTGARLELRTGAPRFQR